LRDAVVPSVSDNITAAAGAGNGNGRGGHRPLPRRGPAGYTVREGAVRPRLPRSAIPAVRRCCAGPRRGPRPSLKLERACSAPRRGDARKPMSRPVLSTGRCSCWVPP